MSEWTAPQPQLFSQDDLMEVLRCLRRASLRELGSSLAAAKLAGVVTPRLPGRWAEVNDATRGKAIADLITEAIGGLEDNRYREYLNRYYIQGSQVKQVGKTVDLDVRGGYFHRTFAPAARDALYTALCRQLHEAPELAVGLHVPRPRCRKIYGRQADIEKVQAVISTGEPMVAVTGYGGFGKTELVRHVAGELLNSRFIDALWYRARPYDFDPTAPENRLQVNIGVTRSREEFVLRGLAAQLGLLPNQLGELKKELRSRPYLVVVDNLEELQSPYRLVDMLKDYLTPSRAILISRHRDHVNHPTVTHFALGGLAQEASGALLRDEAELRNNQGIESSLLWATDDQVRKLWKATCGAPLALHLVVGQSCYATVDSIISGLQRAGGHAEALFDFIFRRDWGELQNSETGRLAQTILAWVCCTSRAAVPHSELVEAQLGEESQLEAALSLLINWSLISASRHENSTEFAYDVHPLTRTFVRVSGC